MAGKVRTWVWVVVAIAVVGILIVLAGAAAGVYFVSHNIQTQTVSASTASSEFDAIRARFTGQKPLIELDARGNFLRSNVDRPAPADARRPEVLYVMAFDPDDGGLVKMKVPFWLLRLKVNEATVSFSDNTMNLEDLKLTVEDLEKFGPSLVLDQKNDGGDRVLVWTE